MNDGIKGKAIPPTGSEVGDTNTRISFSSSLCPSKECFLKGQTVIMLNNIRNLSIKKLKMLLSNNFCNIQQWEKRSVGLQIAQAKTGGGPS